MSETVRDTLQLAPLKLALVADGFEAGRFAELIQSTPLLQLVAQGGMKAAEATPGTPWFDDRRVLLTRSGAEAVALCGSTRESVEVGESAAELGLHVWRMPPLGRTFAEATEIAVRLRGRKPIYRIASWWEHIAEEVRWGLSRVQGFRLHFSELRASAPGPPPQSWRSEQSAAGGGVLMADAYRLLEGLFAIRGLPESISAAVGRYRRRSGEPPRETEDSAAAVFRYESGPALLRATWDVPPHESLTKHDGPDATLIISEQQVSVGQQPLEEVALAPNWLRADLERFVRAVRLEPAEPSNLAIERHGAVNAILDALYLSARTNQPESPSKLYEVQGWTAPRV